MWILTLFLLSVWNGDISVEAIDTSFYKSCSSWSEWINDHHPDARKAALKLDSRNGLSRFANDREGVPHSELRDVYGFCSEGEITEIECREAATDLDYTETGERNLRCDLQEGFRCRGGRRQIAKVCKDYKIRYYCKCSSRNICEKDGPTTCIDTSQPIPFPETNQELKNACMSLQSIFRCLKYHASKCGLVNTTEMNEIYLYSDVLSEVCRRDTELHSKVVQNLRCLKNIFDHDAKHCQGFTKLSMSYLHQEVLELGEMNDHDYVLKVFHCLFVSIHSNCMAEHTLENCGPRAKDVVMEIMEKAKVLDNKCPVSVKREVFGLLEIIAAAGEQEIHVEKFLKNRK